MFSHTRQKWAAIKIQTVFRGCLARRALRALKGLVKLQAVFRGYLVRKQAFATLHSMEALVRAQSTVRAIKTTIRRPTISLEKHDDAISRHVSKMSRHRRRVSASSEGNLKIKEYEESAKIVEVDTAGRPKSRSRSRRSKTSWWVDGDDYYYSHGRQARTMRESEWGSVMGEDHQCRCSTAQSTPRFSNSTCGTPAMYEYYNNDNENYYHPNYMAKTQSFKAKVRSQSAPKQRPEYSSKRRLSLNEMMESRTSLSGVRMQRSCHRAQQVMTINFKDGVVGKLGRASDFVRDHHQDNGGAFFQAPHQML